MKKAHENKGGATATASGATPPKGGTLKSNRIFVNPFAGSSNESYAGAKLERDLQMIKALDAAFIGIEGQERACQKIKEHLFGMEHRSHTHGVGGLIVLMGPPATGKTAISERIAEALGVPFLRLDLTGYNDKEVSNIELFGMQASYKSAEEGKLTSFVAANPCSVVLLDEFDHAHVNVVRNFMQIFERGSTHDRFTGKQVSFRDTVFVITTNVGKSIYDVSMSKYNFADVSDKTLVDALRSEQNDVTGSPAFPGAMVSRFASGKVIMMNRLRPEVVRKIVMKHIEKWAEYYADLYRITVNPDVARLAELFILSAGEGADIREHVKNVKEHFERLIERAAKLAEDSGSKRYFSGVDYAITMDGATPEARALFEGGNKARILLISSDGAPDTVKEHSGSKAEFITSDTPVSGARLRKLDLSACIIHADTEGAMRAFRLAIAEDTFPVYVYSRREGVCHSFFYDYNDRGATGVYSPEISSESFAEWVGGIVSGIDLSSISGEIFRTGKALSYETHLTYNPETRRVTVVIDSMGVQMALRSGDLDSFVDSRSIPDVTFDDVIGAEAAKTELRIATTAMKNYKRYLREGVRIPKGVLLSGEPGTGKTLLAKAVANEAKLPFIQLNATEFLKKYVGEGSGNIREKFRVARKYAPCVMFIDEIDVIAKRRTGEDYHHTDNLVNTFLSEMDGFSEHTSAPVFVIAATNFSTRKGETALDEAFLRRFDSKIHIGLPDLKNRELFMKRQLAAMPGADVSDTAVSSIAKRSVGWSLADLNLVLRNAQRKYESVHGVFGLSDAILVEEFDSFGDGKENKTTEEEKRRTAYHEAGHAVLAHLLGLPLVYSTINSRAGYGGYVYVADEDKTGYTRAELLNRICMTLGGRASECRSFGEDGITTGASSDIRAASRTALSILCEYGMDDSLLYVSREDAMRSPELIAKANRILTAELSRAADLLAANGAAVEAVANGLLTDGSLDGERIKQLIEGV